ncbi:formate dehydrogenase subunit delta [Hylemonella sp. W303a]|uniref:formate dehydrogenase subunit delta n=1 Tax=Hylemonella sp. W303a TaxID=3389873 RepID=UPI00396B1AE1
MNLEHLIRMANQIGTFFAAMPDRAEALEGIANHIHKFWEARMRRELAAAIEAGQAEALLPIVREALSKHPSPA